MFLYIIGKHAPNLTHFTRGLVKYVSGRGYFRPVSSQKGSKFATSPTPPIVERLIPPDFRGGVHFYLKPLYVRPVLSICLLYTNSGCEKERPILIGPWLPAKAAPVWIYLEDYWPWADELSAVNAIGTQMRDPINSGLTRCRSAVKKKKWTPSLKSGEIA